MKRYDGKEVTLKELYKFLRRFSLTDSLYIIGCISNAFKYGDHKVNENEITPALKNWIETFYPHDHHKIALHFGLVRLGRFLILSGANDQKGCRLDIHRPELQQALHMSMNVFEKDIDGIKDFDKIFGRLAQWQFPLQQSKPNLLGRGYTLFELLPPVVPGNYSITNSMLSNFGIDPFVFMATGLSLWIMYRGSIEDNLKVEVSQLKDFVTAEAISKFIELSTISKEEYRNLIRVNDWRKTDKLRDLYALDPFNIRPIMQVERSSLGITGKYIAPNPHAFLHRSSSGIFYLLSDREQQIGASKGQTKQNLFRTYFGIVYREYVKRQLALGKDILLLDLDSPDFLNENDLKSRADFIHIKDTTCIIYEVKTGLLKLDSRVYYDEILAREEIKDGNFKKSIIQLNIVEDYIKENKLIVKGKVITNIKTVIKAIVGYEDIFLANSFILPLIKEHYSENSFQIMTITDIEAIGSRLHENINIHELFKSKMSDTELSSWNITSFLDERAKVDRMNPILESGYKSFMERIQSKSRSSILKSSSTGLFRNLLPFTKGNADH